MEASGWKWVGCRLMGLGAGEGRCWGGGRVEEERGVCSADSALNLVPQAETR